MSNPGHSDGSFSPGGFQETDFRDGVVRRIEQLGWEGSADESLNRASEEVIRVDDLLPALIRLNPAIAEEPRRADEVIARLRAILLSVGNDGLVASNEEFVQWMCGRRTIRYVGTSDDTLVRLIDFDSVEANILRVTTEATFRAGREWRRFDVVLWVNGLPLVVGETKSPTDVNLSWLNGAKDIHDVYERKVPGFFVPNVLSFATEGREFRYGAIHQPPEHWKNWSVTTDPILPPGLPNVMRSVELLLTPRLVLEMLRHFTLYSSERTQVGAIRTKIIARYQQEEAVRVIIARCLHPTKRQGLLWHHQGSGKTYILAFASSKLRRQTGLDAPTIVVVLDRLDLIEQAQSEFESIGLSGLKPARNIEELRRLLSDDARGVIITTIFRFKDAGLLNERSNIVVMVDEAHRTQEGRLGRDMRQALPYATFIGLTGTPITNRDRDTWKTYGDPQDPDGVLNRYTVERSIHDKATLPVHVETRLVNFHFDAPTLQEAFDELADTEGLDEDQRDMLARKGSHISVVVGAPGRISAVCEDIVTHYRAKLAPLGLKAQVVAYNRAACVAYYQAISALLKEGEEATVVMTTNKKEDPSEWDRWDIDRDEEAVIKDRFRDPTDPLKILIVTAKLLTGFNAPTAGVMYLDKPLRAHTLFQAVCRTNRPWINPLTGQEKLYGLIVDYVGIGAELARAVAIKPSTFDEPSSGDVATLLAELTKTVIQASGQFATIDRSQPDFEQIFAAQQILDTPEKRDKFAGQFMRCHELFEFLWPAPELRTIEDQYRFLAKVYASIKPSQAANHLLWHRLGAKTAAIVYEHLTGITIEKDHLETVAMDAELLEVLKDLEIVDDPEPRKPPTATEVLSQVDERIRRRMEGEDPHRVWWTLAERLEMLRQRRIAGAEESVDFLKELLHLARKLLEAEAADDEGRLDEVKVVDPRKGALTQIFETYKPPGTPVVVETVVDRVDSIVQPVRGTGWQTSSPGDRSVRQQLRIVLKDCGLPVRGALFDHAYAYIRENY